MSKQGNTWSASDWIAVALMVIGLLLWLYSLIGTAGAAETETATASASADPLALIGTAGGSVGGVGVMVYLILQKVGEIGEKVSTALKDLEGNLLKAADTASDKIAGTLDQLGDRVGRIEEKDAARDEVIRALQLEVEKLKATRAA